MTSLTMIRRNIEEELYLYLAGRPELSKKDIEAIKINHEHYRHLCMLIARWRMDPTSPDSLMVPGWYMQLVAIERVYLARKQRRQGIK